MNITIIYQYQQTQKSPSISYETIIEQVKMLPERFYKVIAARFNTIWNIRFIFIEKKRI